MSVPHACKSPSVVPIHVLGLVLILSDPMSVKRLLLYLLIQNSYCLKSQETEGACKLKLTKNLKQKMASASVFYNSVNPSASLVSRFHVPPLISKLELYQLFKQQKNSFGNKKGRNFNKITKAKAATTELVSPGAEVSDNSKQSQKKLRILVAGGGIGGLVFALAAKKKGFEVLVFEKDLSAIRGEGQYRGPIQIQSNALAALEAIDMDVAEKIMGAGCITGDRINGLVDGISGNWYIKFDTFTPAVERGLPVTRIVSRMTLQQILASAVGQDIIKNECNVVDFKDDGQKVTVTLENGQHYEGDLLVGADGIWSKVRTNLFGHSEATYSDYTCYTGIADFVPADIELVGYRIFLGHKQYFVSLDVGKGKMQWYAFHKEPPGGTDSPNGKKDRLLKLFDGWCEDVIDLLLATDEDAIIRRDIYDRSPIFSWGKGRTTLLGDSVHAMQPNLGQGGCMAIEDGYQLAQELEKGWQHSKKSGNPVDIGSCLRCYGRARILRVSIIHGLARMAAIMATAYTPYLGVGLGPLSFLTKFRIPHPGTVVGRVFIDIGMPLILSWVLGGNGSKFEGRPLQCRLSDKANDQLLTWFVDDDSMERALKAEWYLFPSGPLTRSSQTIFLNRDEKKSCTIGSESMLDVVISSSQGQVSKQHARIEYKDGAFFVVDLQSEYGTYITDNEGRRYRVTPKSPNRFHPSDILEFGSDKKATFRVKVMKNPPKLAEKTSKGSEEALQVA